MSLTAYITATPLDSGLFKDIYSSLREFKSRFKERFELDHYMGGVVDDTDPTCEGYHKQLTMNGGEYNATNIPATIPACPTGGIVFFSIGGELCCYDGNTASQITDNGQLATGDVETGNSGLTSTLRRVEYCNGTFIATVFSSGRILKSTDGYSWTSQNTGSSYNHWGVCYGNSLYVLTGEHGSVYTSSDLTTWTSRNSVVGIILNGCCYGNSLYVAVGQNDSGTSGRIYTSSDGVTWSNVSGTFPVFISVKYLNSTYIAVGAGGAIYTSTDGATWTSRTSGTSYQLNSVGYFDSTYVAVGANGVILTSSNLTTWTSRTSGTTNELTEISSGLNNLYVIVGDDGTILTSPDLTTWDSKVSGTTAFLLGCCYNNPLFVICGGSGTILTFTRYLTLE